jgi:hypothetical protein
MADYGMTNLDFHNLTLQEAAQVIVEVFGAVSPSLGELNKTEMERALGLFTLGHVRACSIALGESMTDTEWPVSLSVKQELTYLNDQLFVESYVFITSDRIQIRAEYQDEVFHLYGTWATPTIAHLDVTWAAYRGMMNKMGRMGMKNSARGIDRAGRPWKSELTTLDRIIIL